MIGDSGSGLYYLLHKDDIVTMVEMDPVSGQITRVGTKVRKELLPPGGSLRMLCVRGGSAARYLRGRE